MAIVRYSCGEMRFLQGLVVLFVAGILGLMVVVSPVLAAGALGVVSLDLSPDSGQTSVKIAVNGKNAPSTPLSVWIAPEANPENAFQLTAVVQPKEDGSWEAQVYIPREWGKYTVVPGRYLITVQSANKSYVSQGVFTVLSAVNATPQVQALPRAGFAQLLGNVPLAQTLGLVVLLVVLIFVVSRLGKQGA